jgi:hypothetical protein
MFYIMSYNQINGFFSGAFSDIDMLFYSGPEHDERTWTGLISEATGFETSEEAWKLVADVWGSNFSRDTFCVVESRADHTERDEHARKVHNTYNELGRRLATKHISPKTLVEMAEHPHDHGMTFRERWVVDIMSGVKR